MLIHSYTRPSTSKDSYAPQSNSFLRWGIQDRLSWPSQKKCELRCKKAGGYFVSNSSANVQTVNFPQETWSSWIETRARGWKPNGYRRNTVRTTYQLAQLDNRLPQVGKAEDQDSIQRSDEWIWLRYEHNFFLCPSSTDRDVPFASFWSCSSAFHGWSKPYHWPLLHKYAAAWVKPAWNKFPSKF